MHWTSFKDDTVMIWLLLKRGTIANASDRWSQTPLHLAVERLYKAAIEALSEFSDLEIQDDKGQTGERALNHRCCLLYCV